MPRIVRTMAEDGLLFQFLSKINKRFKTPMIATVITGTLSGTAFRTEPESWLLDPGCHWFLFQFKPSLPCSSTWTSCLTWCPSALWPDTPSPPCVSSLSGKSQENRLCKTGSENSSWVTYSMQIHAGECPQSRGDRLRAQENVVPSEGCFRWKPHVQASSKLRTTFIIPARTQFQDCQLASGHHR